ncbi:MAG: MazF family transcriptional regulator [Ignavibacteria bacterium]|nr:MazF family transcriptional regulator [Ignavibacteria bacterium]
MRTKIIKIGNSRGVRLPKAFINDFNLKEEVELERFPDFIAIKPVISSRKDWDDAFAKSTTAPDSDELTKDFDITNEFDKNEWEW